MAKQPVENNYIVENGKSYLEVKNTKGEYIYFLIDNSMIDICKNFKWYALFCPHRKSHYLENAEGVKYHRMIMNTPKELVVDHINRCTYDNRKINLRNVTVEDNSRNIRRPKYQTKPKGSKLGISYISEKGNGYYDVRYHKFKRKYFKKLEDAINYLKELQNMENK